MVCRIRPLYEKELTMTTYGTCVRCTSEQNIDIVVDDASHVFSFDRVFGPESDQLSVFEYTRRLFAVQWGQAQEFIDKEIKRKESL